MRLWTLDEIFRRWPSLSFRIVFETTLPTLAAIVWGLKAYLKTQDVFDVITAAGIAFPIVLFAQGQLFRMAKNVRDEKDADEFRNSFVTIQQGIEALRRQNLVHAPVLQPLGAETAPPRDDEEEQYPTSGRRASDVFQVGRFLRDAEAAFDNGLYYTAALVAAVGFEQALRQTAEIAKLSARRSLGQVVNDLAKVFDYPGFAQKIGTLLRARNGLVHPNNDRTTLDVDRVEARELIEAFTNGIDYLGAVIGRISPFTSPHRYHRIYR